MDLSLEEFDQLTAALLDHEQTLTTLARYVPALSEKLEDARMHCFAVRTKVRRARAELAALTPVAIETAK